MRFVRATTLLIGCTIGAGVLGLPYAIYKSGFITGFLVLLFLGGIMLLINLYLGEIALRTKDTHQLPGYAGVYLGKWGKNIMNIAMVVGIYGALCAYLMGQGRILSELFGIEMKLGIFIFFLIGGMLVYTGLKAIDKAEGWLVLLIVMICLLIFALSLQKINSSNLAGFSLAKIFIPYGVILFALDGLVAIPEMKEELIENKKYLKKCIIIGTITPVILYALFAIAVIGSSASYFSPENAMANLVIGESLGYSAELALNIFTMLALTTSFLALGLGLKWQFRDMDMSKNFAWGLAVIPPLLIAVLDITTFVKALGFVGIFCGGTQAILIVLMKSKAKTKAEREPEYSVMNNPFLSHTLVLLLVIGIVFGAFFI